MHNKELREKAAYEIAFRFASGSSAEEYAKSFLEAYSKALEILEPPKKPQRISC